MKTKSALLLCIIFLFSGCAQAEPAPPPPTVEPQVVIVTVVVTDVPTPAPPEPTPVPPTSEPQEEISVLPDGVLLPGDAMAYIGEEVTVLLEEASCSYRENVNGSPTFCNDEPFPNHVFTLLVWGEDWSFLNGACILVTGEVEEYDGRAEIIAESLDQVADCP